MIHPRTQMTSPFIHSTFCLSLKYHSAFQIQISICLHHSSQCSPVFTGGTRGLGEDSITGSDRVSMFISDFTICIVTANHHTEPPNRTYM